MELMVVLVIIGLLVSAVAFTVTTYVDKGRKEKARADVAALASGIKAYYAEHGKYPPASEWPDAVVPKYVEALPKDPWGNDYQYEFPGREHAFTIICFGSDGREGGDPGSLEADITNWNLTQSANAE